MAKIRIAGRQELVDVTEDRAKQIVDIWEDESIPGHAKLTIDGNIVCKSDIKGVFREKESIVPKFDGDAEYMKGREELLKLSPKERSRKTWGHFSLFHWCMTRKAPDESMKEEVFGLAEKFFTENPEYTKVKLKVWSDYIQIDKGTMASSPAIAILGKVELTEQDSVNSLRTLHNPLRQ